MNWAPNGMSRTRNCDRYGPATSPGVGPRKRVGTVAGTNAANRLLRSDAASAIRWFVAYAENGMSRDIAIQYNSAISAASCGLLKHGAGGISSRWGLAP